MAAKYFCSVRRMFKECGELARRGPEPKQALRNLQSTGTAAHSLLVMSGPQGPFSMSGQMEEGKVHDVNVCCF
jgi:hypothetical protein